jgi:hypothetical protein
VGNESSFGFEMMLLASQKKMSMVQVPVKYQERVGESSVTGSQSKTVKLGLQMIAMCLRMRFTPRSGRK